MLRDLLLGFVKLHILYHAGQAPVYGVWLADELRQHGYAISPGTLYPTLHQLEEKGYLLSEKRVIEGRARKYYTLTAKGRAALDEARIKAAELLHEIIHESDAEAAS